MLPIPLVTACEVVGSLDETPVEEVVSTSSAEEVALAEVEEFRPRVGVVGALYDGVDCELKSVVTSSEDEVGESELEGAV